MNDYRWIAKEMLRILAKQKTGCKGNAKDLSGDYKTKCNGNTKGVPAEYKAEYKGNAKYFWTHYKANRRGNAKDVLGERMQNTRKHSGLLKGNAQ